jgi:outer membrane protein assembly factor BamB
MRAGDVVYLGARAEGGGAVIYAVNAATGADAWPKPALLPSGFDSRATVAVYPELGLLFVGLGGTRPGTILALRMTDGSGAWPVPAFLADAALPAGMSLGWAGTGAAQQPAVFVAAGSHVTALNAIRGDALWTRSLPETGFLGVPVASTPLPQGATLFVAGQSGHVYALTSSTGADAPGWTTAALAPIAGPLALAPPFLYVPTTRGLVALDAQAGGQLWSSSALAATGVAVAAGRPYIGTTDNHLVGYGDAGTPPVMVHDLAITSLVVAEPVSRQAGTVVQVEVSNPGTETESYRLLVRAQPGGVIGSLHGVGLQPGEKRMENLPWPGGLMGSDGPKSVIAQVTLEGAEDSQPANNLAAQIVTVGP